MRVWYRRKAGHKLGDVWKIHLACSKAEELKNTRVRDISKIELELESDSIGEDKKAHLRVLLAMLQ